MVSIVITKHESVLYRGHGNGKRSYECTKKGNLSIIHTLFKFC